MDEQTVTSWTDLGEGTWSYLTGREAAINHQVIDMEGRQEPTPALVWDRRLKRSSCESRLVLDPEQRPINCRNPSRGFETNHQRRTRENQSLRRLPQNPSRA
jgi:hypothetical protein